MRINFLLTLLLTGLIYNTNAQGWQASYSKSKSFIENIGQFDENENQQTGPIKFAVDFGATRIFFGSKGVSYSFLEAQKIPKAERDALREKMNAYPAERRKYERLIGKFLFKSDVVNVSWKDASSSVILQGQESTNDYHNYSVKKENDMIGFSGAKGFKKIIYKDIYPKIDIEYTVHPEIGIKYAVIVHPGGDASMVTMNFDRDLSLLNGKLKIPTRFGDITDHEPVTFYENDVNHFVGSRFVQQQRTIRFQVDAYDRNKTLVIDPWTQTPAFNTNWDVVWECERDGSGNVYILGGIMPMQILKYNSAGALQWTYNTPYDTSNVWLGTFAVDNAGNSYVTAGSSAQIQKVSSAGALVWNNANPGGIFTLTEFWTIAFNCDQTRLVIGGTAGTFTPIPCVYDVNMNNGNVISSQNVTGGGSLGIPPNTPEVRAINSTINGKYYFLTNDSIGYISDNLSLCPGQSGAFRVTNGYSMSYKCEDFRADNSGIEAIAYYNGFIFVNRGTRLDKRDFNTGAILQSATIPNGGWTSTLGQNVTQNSGISIDDCGNIYVGSKTGVYKFDQTLAQTGSYATTFRVYDVEVNTNGEIIACGGNGDYNSTSRSGGVQTFAASACAPIAFTCCDASICDPGTLCVTDSPITLSPGTSGGTWSVSPATTALNTSTGVFNPATAGAGTYTITYTLACGSGSVTLTVNPCTSLQVCEETNGDFTVSNGSGNYTWQSWQSTTTTSNDCAACGGSLIGGFFCSVPLPCTLTTNGWVTYSTSATATPPAGATQIQVFDDAGGSLVINDLNSIIACGSDPCAGVTITVNTTPTNVSCFGGSNGAITASASGASGAFTYSWSPSGSGATLSNLTAGTYTVTATSTSGCTGTASVTITQPASAVSATTSSTATNCGASTGTATANASGGTSPYTYSWSPSGGSAATATNLAAGTYTVTVSDANSCTTTSSVSVSTNNGPTISLSSSSNVSCNGGTNGSATVSGSGGTGTLTYSWTPGGLSGATQSSLAAGTYTATVTDGSGCSNSVPVTITEPSAITITQGTITPANCGVSDGAATVSASGGTGTLSYAWSPTGGSAATASNIPGGSYTVTVTDQNACTSTLGVVVNTIGGPTITVASQTNVSCNGDNDGAASVTVTGGTSPYTYAWTPSGGTAAAATGLSAGTYTVAVTDATSCIGSATVTITEPSALSATATVTPAECGSTNGSIALSVSGGTAPYTYSWSPSGGSAATASNLAPGSYTGTVTDASGCTTTSASTVSTTGSLTITATPDISTINQGDTVSISASGATSYTWTPTSGLSCTTCPNPDASPAQSTNYVVTGSDASGCTGTASVTIIVIEDCGELYVPTVFAPNGSSGNPENQRLCVYGNCISSLSYTVYDRWGNKVFETTTTDLCWDGMYKGKELNAGVFAYKLIVTLHNGDYKEESGNVTLVR